MYFNLVSTLWSNSFSTSSNLVEKCHETEKFSIFARQKMLFSKKKKIDSNLRDVRKNKSKPFLKYNTTLINPITMTTYMKNLFISIYKWHVYFSKTEIPVFHEYIKIIKTRFSIHCWAYSLCGDKIIYILFDVLDILWQSSLFPLRKNYTHLSFLWL